MTNNASGSFVFSPAIEALPWQPLRPGFSLKLIRGSTSDDDARTLLLRIEPGTVIERHRHGGEVHTLTVAGQRKILDTGEVIGPGGYLYEPDGNVDSWMAIGETPVLVFLVARGTHEYLDEQGRVTSRSTTSSVSRKYEEFVAGLAARA
jgi:hypothetical protein